MLGYDTTYKGWARLHCYFDRTSLHDGRRMPVQIGRRHAPSRLAGRYIWLLYEFDVLLSFAYSH